MAKIGYGKIGRSYNLDIGKATSVGGDSDVLNLLMRLAKMYPQHEFILVGKNSGEDPATFGFPSNVTNPWTEWKKDWKMPTDPKDADKAVEMFRRISGNLHNELDSMIVWAGQHGSANSRIPMIGADWSRAPGTEFFEGLGKETNAFNDVVTGGECDALATPQFAFINYVAGLSDFVSRWREAGPGIVKREEIWLCPDPRNYLKMREIRNPIRYPVLAQYDFLKYRKGERYGRFPATLQECDPTGYKENSLWVSNVAYCYSGLELTAVASPEDIEFSDVPGSHAFGMVVNENLTNVKYSRLDLLKEWVLPQFPDAEIRGHWTDKSQMELGRIFTPVPYSEAYGVMKSFATTLTTPASGSGWATAKPWESFALGSICFFHPKYDEQGHIIPLLNDTSSKWDERARFLSSFLRVKNPAELKQRVEQVMENKDLYQKIVRAQREHYEMMYALWQGGARAVSDRINQELGGPYDVQKWTTKTTPVAPKVSTRINPIPRGTRKAPISKRRALRPEDLIAKPIDEASVEISAEAALSSGKKLNDWITDTIVAAIDNVEIESVSTMTNEDLIAEHATHVASDAELLPEFGKIEMPHFEMRNATPVRESRDEYFLKMAEHVATRATCCRRSVGTVLVNKKGHVLATGYNGVPRGFPHCNEGSPCSGASSPSGTNLDGCKSAHAEQNAFLQCADVDDIDTIYVTTSCCVTCVKMALNTGATRIVFRDEYSQPEAKALWLERSGNEWIKL